MNSNKYGYCQIVSTMLLVLFMFCFAHVFMYLCIPYPFSVHSNIDHNVNFRTGVCSLLIMFTLEGCCIEIRVTL